MQCKTMIGIPRIFILWILLAPSLSWAQNFHDETVKNFLNTDFNGRTAAHIYSATENHEWQVTAIYAQPFSLWATTPDANPIWVAQRIRGTDGGTLPPEWADSRSCPALEGALWSLGKLDLRLTTHGLQRPRPSAGTPRVMISSAPTLYQLWSKAEQGDGEYARITLWAISGDLAKWGKATESSLENCWSNTIPAQEDTQSPSEPPAQN